MRSQPLVVTVVLLSSFAVAQTKAPAAQKPATAPAQTPAKSSTTPARTGSAAPAKSAPATSKPAQSSAKPAEVPESAPVITINGLCEGKPASPAACKTVVTRAQFETILEAAAPTGQDNPSQLPPGLKRNLATRYAQLLTVATDAEKQGVQNTPEAQQLLKFARMQALAQAYSRMLQKKYEPTDADIKAFYDANATKLEQATLQRLVVPKTPAEPKTANGKTAEGNVTEAKTADDADKAKAEKLRARAVAGEPFEALQKEAIAGTTAKTAPETKITVQKASLPPDQASVFDLKPGEVSQLISEPAGYFIYKMDSKGPIPLDQVKNEIKQRLLQDKLQAAMEAMLKESTPVLNEQYFGPPPAATQLQPGPNAPQNGAPATPKPSPNGSQQPKTEPQPK